MLAKSCFIYHSVIKQNYQSTNIHNEDLFSIFKFQYLLHTFLIMFTYPNQNIYENNDQNNFENNDQNDDQNKK